MDFFRSFIASMLAFIVGAILLFVFGIMFLAGLGAMFGSGAVVDVRQGTILNINLNDAVSETAMGGSPLDMFDFESFSIRGSYNLLKALTALEAAAADPNIAGVYITGADSPAMSVEHGEELRSALVKFKESGKFVISYSTSYTQLGYYVGSVADDIYMNPYGSLDWYGLSSEVVFYKGLLDKLDIGIDVIRHGSFKSFVEPYIATQMSPENRLQMETVLNTIWSGIVEEIAQSRRLSPEELQKYAGGLEIRLASDARERGMIDGTLYRDEINSLLNTLCGKPDSDGEPRMVSLRDYSALLKAGRAKSSPNKVAVIYVDGTMVSGKSIYGIAGDISVSEQLAGVRRDDDVKAVVLRINSPGGSALAAENIWREVELLRAEKPVVVSMGASAASGGYYIASPADVILSSRSTLTGSIGVFSIFFNIDRAIRNNLGITVDVVKTNPQSDLLSVYRPKNDTEREYIMAQTEDIYTTFVGHVAEGRNMTREGVDAIGEGRVWSGENGVSNGLVDGIGGLADAIILAAERSGCYDDFRIYEVEGGFGGFFSAIMSMQMNMKRQALKDELGEAFASYNAVRSMLSGQGIHARMPYDIEIK